jgi:hypothetical protein
MPDWTVDVLRPLYAEFGIPAVLQLDAGTFELTAIDLTAGTTLSGPVELETVRPAVMVLAGDLADAGILVAQLDNGSVQLNGKSWSIIAHQLKPTTNGEGDGEVALMLEGIEG